MEAESHSSYKELFSIRNFLLMWTGQAVSYMGDQFHYIAIAGLLLYEHGVSAIEVGTFLVSMSAPSILIGPLAGVYVDRWNRKWVLITSDIIRGLLVMMIPFTTALWQIYVVMFLVSSVSRFFFPAYSSVIPNIVSKKQLLKANSLSQTTYNITLVLGPAAGAFVIGLFGYSLAFFINAATFFFSALMILRVHLLEERKEVEGGVKEVIVQMKEGLTLIREKRPVLFVISVFSSIMFFIGGINVLLLVFVRDVLHLGIVQLGILEGFQGGGMILGALAVGIVGAKYEKRSLILMGTFFVGFWLAIFGYNPSVIASYLLISVIGVFISVLTVPSNTLLQEVVPDEIRGRVFAVQGTLVQTFSIISIGWESAVANVIGSQAMIIVVGVCCAGIGILGRLFPEFSS